MAHWTKEAPAWKSFTPCSFFNPLTPFNLSHMLPDFCRQCRVVPDQPTQGSRERVRSHRYSKPWCIGAWSFLCWLVSPWYCVTGVSRLSSTLPTRPNTALLTLNPSRSQPQFYQSKHQERIAVLISEFSQTTLLLSVSCDLGNELTFKTQLGHLKYRSLF